MSKPTFVISSPYDTYSGYGARSRDIIKSIIDSNKYDVQLLSQRWGDTSWGFCQDHPQWEHLNGYKVAQLKEKPDIWMQITIPNEYQPVGKYNIGITAGIEATGCKPEWIEGLNRMDIIYVSSNFTKSVFEGMAYEKKSKKDNSTIGTIKLDKPIKVLFEGADIDLYKPLKPNEVKTFDFKDIKEDFCYLFVGHWMDAAYGHDRKNVSLLVKTFYETFKNKKKKPALILKSSTGVSSYLSRDKILDKIKSIRISVDSKNLPNIYVLSGEFNDQEVNELYNHPKVKSMVSLTKGEGFGRPLLEFSLTDKPVIATGWSGHIDFLKREFSALMSGELTPVHATAADDFLIKEAKWFSVDHGNIGHFLTDVSKNYKDWKVKAKKQGKYSRANFSFDVMKKQLADTLERNVPEISKTVALKLPKLKKVNAPKTELPKLKLPKLKKI